MVLRIIWLFVLLNILELSSALSAFCDEPSSSSLKLRVPEGFVIERVAGPPLIERPITAAFDEQGRLYVGDSSGSNDPVEKQLAEKPHRIVRLEDTDGDGKFDKSTVFADHMMFPEGTLFYEGSLYVSAPPSIWKLTDTDGDGVADQRVEWFQGKTLTGCGNDLHGPYLGRDGWIYWCKGAFAEQTYNIRGSEWKTRASHIFRCRPDGSMLEPVVTGGMDNLVNTVSTPEGERFFTATFIVHPQDGRRDGLAHAVYGGVYGKENGVLEGHPRTGELMPVLVHMGAAAPCGLLCFDSEAFGDSYYGNLFVCQFNMHKVSRHVLTPAGASFNSEDSDFVTSDSVDFHPTDVLMDADGSLLIVDTGGWYKFCCPTSQLEKPDVLGGIYRIRKVDAKPSSDSRGKNLKWTELGIQSLWTLLSDERLEVRRHATQELAAHASSAEMQQFLADLFQRDCAFESSSGTRLSSNHLSSDLAIVRRTNLARVWVLAQVDSTESRSILRQALQHPDESICKAALHVISLSRDALATPELVKALHGKNASNISIAAEALGRIGDASIVPHLLAAAATTDDRILRHSITFALIELADPKATRLGLSSKSSGTLIAALVALDQMKGGGIEPAEVVPLLDSDNDALRAAAYWLVAKHPEWGADLATWFRGRLTALPNEASPTQSAAANLLEDLLVRFAKHPSIQQLLAESAANADFPTAAQRLALRAMGFAKLDRPPVEWCNALVKVIRNSDSNLLPLAIAAARSFQPSDSTNTSLSDSLLSLVNDKNCSTSLRVEAMATISAELPALTDSQFGLLTNELSSESFGLRSSAAEAISRSHLSISQLRKLCEFIKSSGPLELHQLLGPFQHSTDEQLGLELLSTLRECAALSSLRVQVVREYLAKYSPTVQRKIDELDSLVNVDLETQRHRIADLLPQMSQGDVRRGQAIFNGAKASCIACHRMGYGGGNVGPDLSTIGKIRTEHDLLESIVFPSLSFARGFEPMVILMNDGRSFNGLIRNETPQEIVLVIGPNKEIRLRRDEIEEIHPSKVSIMPAGFDKILSTQDLADLIAFLKNAK